MASGGTGDVLAGTIGALLAQGLAPFDAARLGVYLHGQAGELVRERIGDAGLLASDLPEALPMVRKRLAAVAERQRTGRRLGFGARSRSRPGRRGGARPHGTPVPTGPGAERAGGVTRPPALPARSRSRRASHVPACRRSRGSPGSRSTSTRCAGTSRCSASIVGPDARVEPVVKADAYGHGAVPVALALEAAGADGLSVATLDEAFELREAGVTLPLLVIYPIPPDAVAAAAAAGIAVSLGPGEDGERVLRAARRLRATAGGPPRGRDGPRPRRRAARATWPPRSTR